MKNIETPRVTEMEWNGKSYFIFGMGKIAKTHKKQE